MTVTVHVASICPPAKPPKRPSRRKGLSHVLTLFGSQDGIRFGTVAVDGVVRGFLHDRLNGTVRLYRQDDCGDRRVEDPNIDRRTLAKAMLDARWAEERQTSPEWGVSPQVRQQSCESAVDEQSQIAGVKIF
jgi:hypothetical protein